MSKTFASCGVGANEIKLRAIRIKIGILGVLLEVFFQIWQLNQSVGWNATRARLACFQAFADQLCGDIRQTDCSYFFQMTCYLRAKLDFHAKRCELYEEPLYDCLDAVKTCQDTLRSCLTLLDPPSEDSVKNQCDNLNTVYCIGSQPITL